MNDELKEFLKDTAYRCAYTFAEAMLAFLAVGSAITDISWGHALSVAAVATLLCLLKQCAVYAGQHKNPKYSAEMLEELMKGVTEPYDSWSDRYFTDEEIATYRNENVIEDSEGGEDNV